MDSAGNPPPVAQNAVATNTVAPNTVAVAAASPKPAAEARKPRVPRATITFFILGLLFLSYLAGAAAMFFQFPSSGLLSKCFMGARAWKEMRIDVSQSSEEMDFNYDVLEQPDKTFDGYTLVACGSTTAPSTGVYLLNMNRKVVHQWTVSFSKIWPNPPQLEGRQIDDSTVCIFACHLYANGDLLVVFHSLEHTFRGYGLAKVDKDSNLIWKYSANAHHDVTVGEDGTIYTLIQRSFNTKIKGLEFCTLPWMVDHLVMLSPDGKELREPISLLEAVRKSPYAELLAPLETPVNTETDTAITDKNLKELRERQDVLHANSVNVLTRAMAPKFPDFKAGQVLVSLRNLNAIAVIDPAANSVVWGATGMWKNQHDAQFLENGHLMIFNNVASLRGSRVIEFDRPTGAYPWSYPGIDDVPFCTTARGMAQRLPNGNTLVVNSEGHSMLEVTQEKELVWKCGATAFITTARRYGPDQLQFLKPGQGPRS